MGGEKIYALNYELPGDLPKRANIYFPLVLGTSRKSFISKTLAQDAKLSPSPRPAGIAAEKKIWGTATTVTASILQGAHIVRVHDVAEMVSVARIADCILNPTLAPKK
jgi:dihydropteroate synthase